jgi:hypothetical protein
LNYQPAPEVEEIAKSVIDEHFEEIHELQAAGSLKLAYMFRPEAQGRGEGRVCAGQCVRVDDRNHALHGFDFLIVIAKDVWDSVPEHDWRRALVHHELCHVGVRYDEDGAPKVDEESGRLVVHCKNHDIEEFEATLAAYGAWHGDLRKFLAAYKKDED